MRVALHVDLGECICQHEYPSRSSLLSDPSTKPRETSDMLYLRIEMHLLIDYNIPAAFPFLCVPALVENITYIILQSVLNISIAVPVNFIFIYIFMVVTFELNLFNRLVVGTLTILRIK